MKINDNYKQVEYVLENDELARDNLERLIVGVYHTFYPWLQVMEESFASVMLDLGNKVANPSLPSISTIIRNRSRVQNNRPDLRGEDYEKNRRNSIKIKEDLGYGTK